MTHPFSGQPSYRIEPELPTLELQELEAELDNQPVPCLMDRASLMLKANDLIHAYIPTDRPLNIRDTTELSSAIAELVLEETKFIQEGELQVWQSKK